MEKYKQKKVSIIVPIYNVEKYLDECIVSLVHQTYKNIEIILVNDGSPDKSDEICAKWAERDERIKIIQKENGGLSDARNAGLAKVTGEYIFFVDSDDWISINTIEILVGLIEKKDVDMAVCEFANVYSDGRIEGNKLNKKDVEVVNRKQFLSMLLEDNVVTNHVWRKLYKRDLVGNVKFPVGKNFEDIYTMALFTEKCKKIVLSNFIGYFYRQNNEGIVKNISYKNCLDHFTALEFEMKRIIDLEPKLTKKAYAQQIIKEFIILNDLNKVRDTKAEVKELRKSIQNDIHSLGKKISVSHLEKYGIYDNRALFKIKTNFPFVVANPKLKKVKKNLGKIKRNFIQQKLPVTQKSNFNNLKNKKKFIIFATPQYGNLGDQALKFGEINFVRKYFKDYEIVLVPYGELGQLNQLKKIATKDDIFALQAGGNIGTLYPAIDEIQRKAIEIVKDQNIIIFPQTLFYSNNQDGKKLLKKTKDLYESCANLNIFVRDRTSYELATKNFNVHSINLMPDMALSLNYNRFNERNGAMLLLRSDSEKLLAPEEFNFILNRLEKKFSSITQRDMHLYRDIPEKDAKNEVLKQLDLISRSEIVITDRLHGMLFAALTSTPCVVIKSMSPKMRGVYEWIKENKYITFISDLNELDEGIDRVIRAKNNFDNKQIIAAFRQMSKIIVRSIEK